MSRFGGWIRPLATSVACLAVSASLAGTAFAAPLFPVDPPSHGHRPDAAQVPSHSLDVLALLAVALVMALALAALLALAGVAWSRFGRRAASSTDSATLPGTLVRAGR